MDRDLRRKKIEEALILYDKYGSSDSLFRAIEPFCISNMLDLANNAESESVKFQANKDLLDRVQGKAVQRTINIEGNFDGMTVEQIQSFIMGTQEEIKRLQGEGRRRDGSDERESE